ncbi:fumarylacetoacetate hydrolase family protein [Nitratidesulfovibrio vulgaris]|uniref:Fumarylacetoacetate hydrolase family protein n=1 Tax=Nitratidesulfovibrio vulgaris (strain ATCC 29579 / DSM 644 / CCUG 34227 / NCIMB 8303 / VKM B-1760 / Hildenborough) TaxID=882 RepID=Q72DQ4_NITV2|nr:fumarylacetoacetate hydrolase family protein [Nitratidesulfovibrio vulgaris]AAS95355.1 fumarylacetoacetate hydrolase family protein [Nitratidesulfovibrio vulgaris str. Hildenborough]ADP85970.1 5-carboxymethyl-2-hydroxymuconate Delta-isomerase [Nitratidesulfovibrio vulgaris RCH1]
MRVIRVRHRGSVFFAALQDDGVVCLNRQLGYEAPIPLSEITLLPVVAPSKVVCVGLNYRGHAGELGMDVPDEPVFFLKAPTAIIGTGEPIVLPPAVGRVDYEGELALVVGKQCRNITPEQAREHIFGFTCANDVTARDIQKRDGLFGRCKGYDTFCPVGPWIETALEDPGNLTLRTVVNGEVRQQGNTADMLVHPFELLSSISRVMTLLPGDLVLTGTPEGIGPIHAGDEVRVEIDEVGLLTNPVIPADEDATGDTPLQ